MVLPLAVGPAADARAELRRLDAIGRAVVRLDADDDAVLDVELEQAAPAAVVRRAAGADDAGSAAAPAGTTSKSGAKEAAPATLQKAASRETRCPAPGFRLGVTHLNSLGPQAACRRSRAGYAFGRTASLTISVSAR